MTDQEPERTEPQGFSDVHPHRDERPHNLQEARFWAEEELIEERDLRRRRARAAIAQSEADERERRRQQGINDRTQAGAALVSYRVGSREYPYKTAPGCKVCFAPGTLIRTIDGFVPIEEVQEGDLVLSSDGTFQPVLDVMVHDHDGSIYEWRTNSMTSSVLATGEHPVLAMVGTHPRGRETWCSPGRCGRDGLHGKPRDDRGGSSYQGVTWHKATSKWMAYGSDFDTGKRKHLGLFKVEADAAAVAAEWRAGHPAPRKGHGLEWVEVKDLVQWSFLAMTWPKHEVEGLDRVFVPEWARGAHYHDTKQRQARSREYVRRGPVEFELTEDFLWMVGLYLAEGSAGQRQIVFTLHEKEIEYQERLITLFNRYGLTCTTQSREKQGQKSVNVQVSSSMLAEWFPAWLGSGCDNKRIPAELLNLPGARVWPLIQGVLDGDGCAANETLAQTSEVLALQVADVILRLGGNPYISTSQRVNRKRVWIVGNTDPDTQRRRVRRWQFTDEEHGERLLAPVLSMRQTMYAGPVYNLEVGGNHTYVVQNIAVHNCHSPWRASIESQLASGRTCAQVAKDLPEQAKLGYANLYSHKRRHLPPELATTVALIEKRAEERGLSIERGTELLTDEVTLARLVVQRTTERLVAGDVEPSLADGLAAGKWLGTLGTSGNAAMDEQAYTQSMIRFFQITRATMAPDQWQQFLLAVRDDPILVALNGRDGDEDNIEDAEVVG